MGILVYGDFTCPDCWLAEHRCGVLARQRVPVDWRAVEHTHRRAVTATRFSDGEREALARRLAELEDLLLPGETLPGVLPAVAPRTGPAVSAYAEAYGSPVAGDVRRLLFDLYWHAGADIGDPAVLRTPLTGPMLRAGALADAIRESGYAVSVTGDPITTEAYHRIRAWRAEWEDLGSPVLPLVLVDGATLIGADALHRLAKEIDRAGADVPTAADDPCRYPDVAVRPSPAWVSQVGGRWRTVHRGDA